MCSIPCPSAHSWGGVESLGRKGVTGQAGFHYPCDAGHVSNSNEAHLENGGVGTAFDYLLSQDRTRRQELGDLVRIGDGMVAGKNVMRREACDGGIS